MKKKEKEKRKVIFYSLGLSVFVQSGLHLYANIIYSSNLRQSLPSPRQTSMESVCAASVTNIS